MKNSPNILEKGIYDIGEVNKYVSVVEEKLKLAKLVSKSFTLIYV